jgi:hypothetical protein
MLITIYYQYIFVILEKIYFQSGITIPDCTDKNQ